MREMEKEGEAGRLGVGYTVLHSITLVAGKELQKSPKGWAQGLVNFDPALARAFYPRLFSDFYQISCGRFNMTGKGPRAAEFPVILKQAHDTEISKKAWLFAKLQPGRARKRINAT